MSVPDCSPTLTGNGWDNPINFSPCASRASCTFTNNAAGSLLGNPQQGFCGFTRQLTFLDSNGNALYSVDPTARDAAVYSCVDGVLFVTYYEIIGKGTGSTIGPIQGVASISCV